MSEHEAGKQPIDDDEVENPNVPQYKVSDKKTVDEYKNLDAEDESLAKWKASLGLAGGSIGEPGDERRVVVLEMTMFVGDQPPVTINMEDTKIVEELKTKPFKIIEYSKYHLRLKFRVQHEIVTGLQYSQVSKRKGLTLNRVHEVCGSYPPNTAEKPFYEKDLSEGEAPGGFLARGSYTAESTFVDDDGTKHLVVPWCFDIVKP